MNKGCLAYILLCTLPFVLGGLYVHHLFSYGELANKSLYSKLQGFAAKQKYNPPFTLGFKITPLYIKSAFKNEGFSYDLLGIPTGDRGAPYFWVVTNTHIMNDPTSSDTVFIVSSGDGFNLPCGYFYELTLKENVDPVVYEFLRVRCIQ